MNSMTYLRRGGAISALALVGCLFAAPVASAVEPSPSPSPSVTAEPSPSPSPTVTAPPAPTAPAVVVLDSSQFDVVVWIGGALLAFTLVGVVGSWVR